MAALLFDSVITSAYVMSDAPFHVGQFVRFDDGKHRSGGFRSIIEIDISLIGVGLMFAGESIPKSTFPPA